ncbi:hypothetical protein [Tahibacter caeni]|uniref:hypothetical protein n=1 Tax=Tahibacter caeni TaxID=1453545 RepID=UPI0021499536|nr:hypothetical protein [Tahibacter caeni]
MSNWQEMFEPRRAAMVGQVSTATSASTAAPTDEGVPAPDLKVYHPWILQRGRSHPAMFIDFRRFDPKSGLLMGCQMSYPMLLSIEYTGDKLVSLDFGQRKFMIEGAGLIDLARHLQQGIVLAVQEYSESIWNTKPEANRVTRIARFDAAPQR